MRTSTKIVALMAASSNAFFTEMFSHQAAVATPQTTKFSESLYSAQDWVYNNWEDGTEIPIDYDGSYDGTWEGAYGGDVDGYIDYSVNGVAWYLDNVYAVGLTADYNAAFYGNNGWVRYGAAGEGYGALGVIYAADYDYWYLGTYGGSEGYLAVEYSVYYWVLAGEQFGTIYYQAYHGQGWLAAGQDGEALYGYGDYDTLAGLYAYGYEYAAYILTALYLAAVMGYGDVQSYDWDYEGDYSLLYEGYEFSGPYYVNGESWYFYYATWTVWAWNGVFAGQLYAADGSAGAGIESYQYSSGVWAWSWAYDTEIYASYWVDASAAGYYDGDDYTVLYVSFAGNDGLVGYAGSELGGAEWEAGVGYASTEIEVSYWVEYFATELLEYYYASM